MEQSSESFKRKKGLLKNACVVTRTDRVKLRTLAVSLREELKPQGVREEFVFEKLILDISRLGKLYAYETKHLLDENRLHNIDDRMDRFLRFKKAVQKDISDGYKRLEDLKEARFDAS